jgi:acyl dehydratase
VRIFTSPEDLTGAVGEELGPSDWVAIDQERVNAFADATDDHQWIHVDIERAAAGPFGGTVAHGYLTLSLLPMFGARVFRLDTPGAKLNYGLNKVRFPAPVPVGSRVRARAKVIDVSDVPAGKQVTFGWTIEIENGAKPACVAEAVVLLLA